MGVSPDNKAAKIEYYKSRLALWTANSVAIGSSAAQILEMSALVAAAEAAFLDQTTQHNAAQAATLVADDAIDAMDTLGSIVVGGARQKARTAGSIVYALANIPAPATPTPVGPLSKPTMFAVAIEENGELVISWKATQPVAASGVVYQVWRKLAGETEFKSLGGTGEKKFVDASVPAGTAQVVYQLQAVRSNSTSPWAWYTVNLGMAGGGAVTATVTEGGGPSIAA